MIILKVGGEAGWEIVITSQAKNEDSNDNGGIALILVEKSSKRINFNEFKIQSKYYFDEKCHNNKGLELL